MDMERGALPTQVQCRLGLADTLPHQGTRPCRHSPKTKTAGRCIDEGKVVEEAAAERCCVTATQAAKNLWRNRVPLTASRYMAKTRCTCADCCTVLLPCLENAQGDEEEDPGWGRLALNHSSAENRRHMIVHMRTRVHACAQSDAQLGPGTQDSFSCILA